MRQICPACDGKKSFMDSTGLYRRPCRVCRGVGEVDADLNPLPQKNPDPDYIPDGVAE